MISVIVPHYKETLEDMLPLLSSLNIQQGIDFNDMELLIINANREAEISAEHLKDFKNIYPRTRTFFNEKEGYMGISRQIGIDNAKGDYAIFCDADDMLYSATVLYDLLTRKGADVYSFQFVEEVKNGDNSGWVIHESQFTWMFAKSYRIQFLKDHHIRFSDTILWHEDTYFNQVLLAYNPVVEVLGYVGYVWKFSPNSITRRNNGEYTSKSMCMYIDALDERLERIKYILSDAVFANYVVSDIVYIYCTLQNNVQIDVLNSVRGNIEKRLAQYIVKYDPNLLCTSPKLIQIVSQRIRDSFANSIIIPLEGFNDFVHRIVGE